MTGLQARAHAEFGPDGDIARLSLSDASKTSPKVPHGGILALDNQNLSELVTRNWSEVDKSGTHADYPSWQHRSSKSSAAFPASVLNEFPEGRHHGVVDLRETR
jgi:hypothetical protein